MKQKIFTLFILFLLLACNKKQKVEFQDKIKFDFADIKKRGTLIVSLTPGTSNYFIYKGIPMGFSLDIIKKFAKANQLKLKVITHKDLYEAFKNLTEGRCDIIVDGITVSEDRKAFLNFTIPFTQTRQVLIQRKEQNKLTISSIEQLANKTIYIPKQTIYKSTLSIITEELDEPINVIELSNYNSEELIQNVANNNIDYTVTDEHLAYINKKLYPILDYSIRLTGKEDLAWACRLSSPELLNRLNQWLEKTKKTRWYRLNYNKYHHGSWIISIGRHPYHSFEECKISKYDKSIIKHVKQINWDWRLLASLIYQESEFNPHCVSQAGAMGIMQIMPETAIALGIKRNSGVDKQIKAGSAYLNIIDNSFKNIVPDSTERIKFVIAAYNIGIGHIMDAVKLTEKYKSNPQIWDSVAVFLRKKSKRKYYNDPVVLNGPCIGIETTKMVEEIIERSMHYQNLIDTNQVKNKKLQLLSLSK